MKARTRTSIEAVILKLRARLVDIQLAESYLDEVEDDTVPFLKRVESAIMARRLLGGRPLRGVRIEAAWRKAASRFVRIVDPLRVELAAYLYLTIKPD